MKTTIAAALLGAGLIAGAAPATITVGYEAAGVQQTTKIVSGKQVATFDAMSGWIGSGDIFSGRDQRHDHRRRLPPL